ncbi:hypothetical protein DEO72_LG6g1549 [Vigna unguiculata]|uniref:Uncharacterized protein n=1 Tax=Vigna unguiculata TaxID=3917 RepID=A0A4D6M619_VIGUN|nr:hypothetical protein DEO72_LG6g1549 [Vigna unguiculata]
MVGLLMFHGLWPRIGVKHVAFYGLWPGMNFFELWLGIADEHEEPLSYGSGWRVCRCECAGCGQYGWVRIDCPPTDEFGSSGTIGVKHVAFYGLWPGMNFFELWLGIADEHEEPLSYGSGWRVCRCECAGCGQYGWVRIDCPPTDEFGSSGTLRTMFVFGNFTWRYGV